MEYLWVVSHPRQHGVIHASVERPILDPLHVGRLASLDDGQSVTCMCREQVAHAFRSEVGRCKHQRVRVQGARSDLAFQHQTEQGVLHRRVGLAVLVNHQDDGLVQVHPEFLVGYVTHEGIFHCVGQVHHVRDRDVAQVLGRAIKVARCVSRQVKSQGLEHGRFACAHVTLHQDSGVTREADESLSLGQVQCVEFGCVRHVVILDSLIDSLKVVCMSYHT